ncbi:MAG: hypothetical protein IH987_10875 [Planctomycetes bacterium]|nr:hypothetical protein [Planctomycetota bacterium]
MSFWEIFWQVILLVSVVAFAGLVVVVAIGGFGDIRSMLRDIDKRHETGDSKSDSDSTRTR